MGWGDYDKKVNKLARNEREFISDHPMAATDFQEAANKALSEAKSRYPATLHNGEGDAFRHCFWNAMMTRMQGEKLAQQFADAHEMEGGPLVETLMDLHNNKVGRGIGVSHPNATDTEMATYCVQALDTDKLVVIQGNTLVKSKTKVPYSPAGPRP